MHTLYQYNRKEDKRFFCLVKRSASKMRYHDPSDGRWKPVNKERWEFWTLVCSSVDEATSLAKYHFFNSNNILIGNINNLTNKQTKHLQL